eukprot:140687-Pyramimonas_sp.AAC.1
MPIAAIANARRHRSSSPVPAPRHPTRGVAAIFARATPAIATKPSSPIARIIPDATHRSGSSWSLGPSAMKCTIHADMRPCALDAA